MRARLGIAIAALLLAPAAARPQAEVSALALGSDPVDSTDQLRLSRFADLSEETTVETGTLLEIGDLLSSVSQEIDVELACGEDILLRFSGGFRLLIDDPEEADCALDLLSGTVDAVTDEPVEVTAGDVTLGVEGTQFSFSLSRGEEGPDRELAVFDGAVRLRSEDLDEEVGTGRSWQKGRGAAVWGEVSSERAERTAALFARIEVAKSAAAGEVEDKQRSYEELRQLHYSVLTQPENKEKRIELARAQMQVKRDDLAAYHLRRAEVDTEEELETYDIDKRVLSKISRAPAGVRRTPLTAGLRQPGMQAADPFELIRQGSYREAIQILDERAREEPTSEVYHGLAKAWAALEGASSATARSHAAKALELHADDGLLSRDEAMACRRMRGRSYP